MLGKNSEEIRDIILNNTVKNKGNNLNNTGTANSVSNRISCEG